MKKIADDYNLPSLIKDHIINKILHGELKPGDKLIEMEYAEEFGTSRAPIREAFSLLMLEGFVQKLPRRGTIVKGYTVDEIRDLLNVRNYLEEMSIRKLSTHANSLYLDEMKQLLIEMAQKQDQPDEYAKLNYKFHYQIILASQSTVISSLYNRLGTALLSIQTMSFMEMHNIRKSLLEHNQIVQFLEEGDLQKAGKLLHDHNEAVFPRIEGHFLANK